MYVMVLSKMEQDGVQNGMEQDGSICPSVGS